MKAENSKDNTVFHESSPKLTPTSDSCLKNPWRIKDILLFLATTTWFLAPSTIPDFYKYLVEIFQFLFTFSIASIRNRWLTVNVLTSTQ